MLTKIVDWSSILGAVASAVGVWVGVCALKAANRAELAAKAATDAAKEATEAARRGHAAEELLGLSNIAKEMVEFVEGEQWGQASVRAGDLLFQITHCVERWDRFFSPGGRKKFRELRTELASLKHLLSADPVDENRGDKAADVAYAALLAIRAEAGKVQKMIEVQNNGGE